MAKIIRKNQRIFGSTAGFHQLAQIGSLAASSPAYSSDPDVIQSLSNYLAGWFNIVIGANSPAIEDMNSLCYLFAYQLAYLFQAGVAEWNTSTVYYIGSFASDGLGKIYRSITDANTGNALTDTTNWLPVLGPIVTAVNPATDSPKTLVANDTRKYFDVNTANGAQTITLPAAALNYTFTVKDVGGSAATNNITIARAASEKIENLSSNYVCKSPYGVWTFYCDGTNWWLNLPQVAAPTNQGLTSSYFPIIQSAINNVSANYTILTTDGYSSIFITTGSTARTVVLPAASANAGRQITIKKVDIATGGLTVARAGSDTIDGATSYLISAPSAGAEQLNSYVTLQSDGVATWNVVAENVNVSLRVFGTASSASINTVINYLTIADDTHGGYSAGRYTVPFEGIYTVSIGGQAANPSVHYGVFVNGVVANAQIALSDTLVGDAYGTYSIAVAAGAIIDTRPTSGSSGAIQSTGWMSISRG